MKFGCAVRDWRSLEITRSLRFALVRRGHAPDCFALSIVVFVELSLPVVDDLGLGLIQLADRGQLHPPPPLGWRHAQTQLEWFAAHEGALVTIVDQYVKLKYT